MMLLSEKEVKCMCISVETGSTESSGSCLTRAEADARDLAGHLSRIHVHTCMNPLFQSPDQHHQTHYHLRATIL